MEKLEVEIFKTGDYGEKGKYSEDDLEQIAKDYDPKMHEAPVTIDHSQTGPALGWVESLKRIGGKLIATLRDLNPSFINLLKSGSFKKRSIELYKELKSTNKPYLRALTFLGAQIPEIKSLSDPLFNDSDKVFFALDFSSEEDESKPTAEKSDFTETAQKSSDSTSIIEIENLKKDKELAERKVGELKRELRRKEFISFCESAKSQGKLLPAWESSGLMDFLLSIDELPVIPFGENKTISPVEWFFKFINSLPPIVHFQEIASQTKPHSPSIPTPPIDSGNTPVNPASLDLYNRAVSFMEENPAVSYVEALLQVSRV